MSSIPQVLSSTHEMSFQVPSFFFLFFFLQNFESSLNLIGSRRISAPVTFEGFFLCEASGETERPLLVGIQGGRVRQLFLFLPR